MPLIRYREKETTPEVRAFIGEIKLNGEPIEVHRGVFYLRSDFLIRYLRQRIEKREEWDSISERLKVAQLTLDWLESCVSIPEAGIVPTEQIAAAISSFADEVISQKGYDHAECPACGRHYSASEIRLFYWSEDSLTSRSDGNVSYCGEGHVINFSILSVSSIFVDFSLMEDPWSYGTKYQMIEKFPSESPA
jgi:hypothetical protein